MLLKSLLFVPAKEKMLRKIGTLEADAYIIDLEDSIEESDKETALKLVCEFLDNIEETRYTIVIRVNKDRYTKEITKLSSYDVSFMLPKYEQHSDYINLPIGKDYIALIETPLGILNAREIASDSKIVALAFGAEDFTAGIGMDNCVELLLYPKSTLVVCAKA